MVRDACNLSTQEAEVSDSQTQASLDCTAKPCLKKQTNKQLLCPQKLEVRSGFKSCISWNKQKPLIVSIQLFYLCLNGNNSANFSRLPRELNKTWQVHGTLSRACPIHEEQIFLTLLCPHKVT